MPHNGGRDGEKAVLKRENLEYKKVVLPNTLRIVTEEIPYVRSASIGFWVGVGSRFESEIHNGLSHFIEHLIFKGTRKRTARDIARVVDSIGGQLNAFTSKEYTCYYARVLDEHFSIALDLLTDMVFNSLLSPEDIVREKNVIAEEISMYEDSPEELVLDVLAETVWGGHPLSWPVIGKPQVITSATRDTLLDHYSRFYQPGNMVVAVAGNVSHERVVEEVRCAINQDSRDRVIPDRIEPRFRPAAGVKRKDIEQVHLCVGMPGLPMGHERQYTLLLLNSILGGGTSSRLFQKIREEMGLAYSVYSFQSTYRDAGLFGIYAATSPGRVEEVLELILKECASIMSGSIDEEELHLNKEQLKGSLMLSLESTGNRMSRLGKSELCLERILTPDQIIEKIEAVTVQDLLDMAGEIFASQGIALTAVGPFSGEELVQSWPDKARTYLPF